MMDPLEPRRLLSGIPWGAIPRLIGQDQADDYFQPRRGTGQTVAILDTGIDYNHPNLGGGFGKGYKVIGGWDFVDNDPDPLDTWGHGTQVAGIIAADEFEISGARYRGIAPDARLVALRIAADSSAVTNVRMEQALQWVLTQRAALSISVVNISYGFGHFDTIHSDPRLADELASLAEAGVLVVASTGNEGVSSGPGIDYPAADRNVISVGSVNEFDVISNFSERGALLDILAPGEGVATTGLHGEFLTVDGTSFAAPVVAGTAAILKQISPLIGLADTRSILRASSTDNFDGDSETGSTLRTTFPRLSLHRAIALAELRVAAPVDLPGKWGNSNDMAVDEHGVLHFAYYDSRFRTLRHATRSPGLGWSTATIVDNSGNDVGSFLSLAVDHRGRPAIAYFDATFSDLRFAQHDGSQWLVRTVDAPKSVGQHPSLLFDTTNSPVIAYYRRSGGDLRLARREGENWLIQGLDTGPTDAGRWAAIGMDSIGRLAVAYADSSSGDLKLARQNNRRAWEFSTIDTLAGGAAFISLAFDRSNYPVISYYDVAPADLKLARQDRRGWARQLVASRGAQGAYSNVSVRADGTVDLWYWNRRTNQFTRASSGSTGWIYTALANNAGRHIGLVQNGDSVTLSWFEDAGERLNVAQF